MPIPAAGRICGAVDTHDTAVAESLVADVGGAVGGIKLGLEFFLAHGQAGVRRAAGGRRLFLDLKLHDIPNTVVGGMRAVLPLDPWFLQVPTVGEHGRASRREKVWQYV